MADTDGATMGRADGGDDAEAMARIQEEINNLPVSEHVLFMMQSLSSLAVDRLGLGPKAGVRRDLAQARLAIDALKALLSVLEQVIPAEETSAHRGVLSQLQMAYVGALSADSEPAAPEPVAEASTADEATPAAPAAPAAEAAPVAPGPSEAMPKKAAKPRAGSQGDVNTAGAKAAGSKASGGAGAKKGS